MDGQPSRHGAVETVPQGTNHSNKPRWQEKQDSKKVSSAK